MLDVGRCRWQAADFDGPAAMLVALAYLKAARAVGAPAALATVPLRARCAYVAVLHSPGRCAHGRQVGLGLLREAIAQCGRMDLSSYGRLPPSQDLLQLGGLGNLIAAPLQGQAR